MTSAPESSLNVTQSWLTMMSAVHGLCSLALTSPRKTSKSELEVSANSPSLTTFTRLLARQHFATLFRAFVTSSILGGTSLPVVLLTMSALRSE